MQALTPEERRELGSKGGRARWGRSRKPSNVRPVEVLVDGKWERFESVTDAADAMGVPTQTLYYRMKPKRGEPTVRPAEK